MENEIWLPVVGYEDNYMVSDLGNVKSISGYKTCVGVLKLLKLKSGYLSAHLCKNNKASNHSVHRLVAKAFLPNPNNLPQVNHKDRNKHNNSKDNLEWISVSENNIHAYAGAHNKKRSVAQIDPKTGEIIRVVDTIRKLKEFGINTCHVTSVCRGNRKLCSGFYFKYI